MKLILQIAAGYVAGQLAYEGLVWLAGWVTRKVVRAVVEQIKRNAVKGA